jgi:hypothetical protein
MYKIGDGKTVVPDAGTFDDTNRFNPGNFTGGFNIIDGVPKNAEVAGFYLKNYTNYATNIESILIALRDEIIAKTKLDLNHFWALTPDLFKEYNQIFELPHKEIFRDFLSDKIANYINDISAEKISVLRNLERNTAKMGAFVNGLSIILDGYDIKTDPTRTYFYEVIPNEYKLSGDPKTLFGYEPYYEYKMLSFDNYQILSFTDIRDVIYDVDLNFGNKLRFLSLGNGIYFFKQISKDNKIKQISGNNYTFDNYLPESIAIKDYVSLSPTAPNFVVTTGVKLNTKVDKNGGLNGETTTLTVQPTGNEDKAGSYDENYKMKYTFEKLNYEFFDFSNKNLDIMLNDNYMKRDFDMDIKYDNDKDFYYQANQNGSLLLFYNGTRKKLVNIPISYYTLNVDSVTNTPSELILNDINQFITYDFTITKEFVEDSAKSGLTNVIGAKIEMSGLIDLFFIKVLSSLTDADKAEILAKIKEPGNEPKKGISSNEKTKTKQIEQRYKKIETILNKVFIEIKTYVNQANSKLKPLHSNYIQNEELVLKKMNKILVDNESFVVNSPESIANKLIKGSVQDYTVVIKDTVEVKGSTLYNYTLFTNTRGLFNIISQSEEPEIIEKSDETEFSKYLKYDVGARTN